MKTTQKPTQKSLFKKKENSLDQIYRYIREISGISEKFSGLPEDLEQAHQLLIQKAWGKFDEERGKKEVVEKPAVS